MNELAVPRIFVDANVILAGAASITGASHAILVLGNIGIIRLVTSQYVLSEVTHNLAKKLPQALQEFRRLQNEFMWEIVAEPSGGGSVLPDFSCPVKAIFST